MIRGRTFEAALANTDPHREFDIAFTALVYTGTDSTMHLICLWGSILIIAMSA
jgi:hypothetical protein